MSNPSKIRGTRWESDVVSYLRSNGFDQAERRALAGQADLGDIVNAGPYVWECKSTQRIELAKGMDETKEETKNANVRFGFLINKRRNKSVGEAYATMTLAQLCEMLTEITNNDQPTSPT